MKIIPGSKFGRLTVKYFEGRNKQYDSLWRVKCDCGNETIVRGGALKNGHTQSCGCLQRERTAKAKTIHGLFYDKKSGKRSRLYRVWTSMKERCFNPNSKSYKDYGERGISVHKEWAENYFSFHEWAVKTGYKEGLTIDRKDVNGNYEPSNCRWIPKSQQSRNRRINRYLTFCGIRKSVAEWEEITSIPAKIINQRIRREWGIEKTLTTKV